MIETHSSRLRSFSKKDIKKFLPFIRLSERIEQIPIELKDENMALDYLTYGIVAKKALIGGKKIDVTIMLSLNFENELNLVCKANAKPEKINLSLLTDISFGSKRGNFLKNKIGCSNKKLDFSNLSCISLFKSKGESLDLLFSSENILNIFSVALLKILENIFEKESELENQFTKPIKKLWNIYDTDRSNKLELAEFTKLIKHMNLDFSKFSLNVKNEKAIKEIFEKIDKDNSGQIEYEEFIAFVNMIISGSEFSDVFHKYSNGKNYMDLDQFHQFLIKEQRQANIKIGEAAEIILDYKFHLPESTKNNEKNRLRLI